MATYEIHGPLTGDRGATAEALKAMRVGFCYSAFVFGPFWLTVHRLWAPLAVYLVAAAVVCLLVALGLLAPGGGLALELAAGVFLGLEGPYWRSHALARRGRPLLDLVEASGARGAADLFILRNLVAPTDAPLAGASPHSLRAAPPPGAREIQVLGLFPEARRP